MVILTLTHTIGLAKTDLTELSLEELMDVEVTTATKRPQKLSDTAAAVYVINQEDIRRSGATSIPEALRMVPGVQVAQIDANKWAISIRGFNNHFSDKILVLMDGRTVYNTLFSGVFWDVQDYLLEDIDRIEVIRGPGGSLWGANAVNGIINVITKDSKDTQGGLITAGIGTEEKVLAGARYGGKFNDKASYRIYGKYLNRDERVDSQGDDAWDDWDMFRAGFRSDILPSAANKITLQGDIYSGNTGSKVETASFSPPFTETFVDDFDLFGGNFLGRYSHTLSDQSDFSAQAYYDRAERQLFLGEVVRDTLDFDFQHRILLGTRNDLIWGVGYRYIHHDINLDHPEIVAFDPMNRSMDLFSAFIQDEFTLVPEKLTLTAGSKFEYNDFSGFEFQPNLHLLWNAHEKHTFWGAASRAVRTPSRANHDINWVQAVIPPQGANPFQTVVQLQGDEDVDSEKLLSFELGYRTSPWENLIFDIAAFYYDYDDLLSDETGAPAVVPPTTTIPVQLDNENEGSAYGFEFLSDWQPIDRWKLQLAYSFLQLEKDIEEKSPKHQLSLRSMMNLPYNLQLDLWLRSIDELDEIDIPDYTTLDARLGWRPLENLELSLVGQNLFEARHLEFADSQFNFYNTEVERSAYVKLTWEF